MLSVCWQVCLSDIREETGTYSCLLFVGRCACLILKVPKREIFDCSNFPDFYTIKSLREGDFGVKFKK
jgi:hypothetical protein